jgi:hypothetical protein
MRRLALKIVVMVAQSSTFTVMLGYIITKSQWVVVPGFVAITILIFGRCASCGTPFQDPRICSKMKLMKFYDTSMVDQCPGCQKPMAVG